YLYTQSFSFTITPTTTIYTLSLHDALPISLLLDHCREGSTNRFHAQASAEMAKVLENVSATECGLTIGAMYLLQAHSPQRFVSRSEEHTSELQSRENLVCRLLLEKKKKKIK